MTTALRPLSLLATLLLAACAPSTPDTAPAANGAAAPTVAARPEAPAPAAPPPATKADAGASIESKSDLLDFSYAWPAAAAAIPRLDARLRADARTMRQRGLNMAGEDRRTRGSEFPFHRHTADKSWTVEGEAAGLLALRGESYTFTGGAHGMSGFEFILWDRAADRDIAVKDLFADWPRARAELVRLFCPALDEQREEKRGEPVDKGDDMFGGCPGIDQQVLIPSDVGAGAFTTIRVLIGPYEAGPYSEGSYDVPLPVTPALVALLKPERRGALAPRETRNGRKG